MLQLLKIGNCLYHTTLLLAEVTPKSMCIRQIILIVYVRAFNSRYAIGFCHVGHICTHLARLKIGVPKCGGL